MSFNFDSTGGYFTRLGKILQTLSDCSDFGALLGTDTDGILTEYSGTHVDEAYIDGISGQLTSSQAQASAFMTFLQQVSVNTTNGMIYEYDPLLSNTNLLASLQQIIRLMKAQNETVLKMTVACTNSANGGNLGNGVCVSTSYRPDGLTQEYQVPETITLACTADSTSNSNLAGNEQFSVTGTLAQNDMLLWDWPLGSGASTILNAINPTADNSQGNILTNSDFESFSTNTPNNWVITVGTAGTQVLKSTTHYTGSFSVEFVGDSSTLTAIKQTFGTSSGTVGNVTNLALYAINTWVQVDVVPAAGVLEFALVDGSGTVINDQEGNQNLQTHSLTGLTMATWTPISTVFRTPYILPAVVKLRVRLSTALTTGSNLFIDQMALGAMEELYQGGPSFAVFSGSSNFYLPDGFSASATNSFGAASTLNTFQIGCQRLFNLTAFGLQLPSSNSPTVLDALIS